MADSGLENSCMKTHRQTVMIAGACLLAAGAAACGSSAPPSPKTSPPSPSNQISTSPMTSPATGSTTAAAATITANWEKFFNFATPAAQRVPLLEDGSEFNSIIQSELKDPLYSGAHGKVVSVTGITPTQATVKYDVLLGSTVATTQTGTAVYQDGTWKVSAGSFCTLLILEGAKPLPAVCNSAG
jgi:hypothetical protein